MLYKHHFGKKIYWQEKYDENRDLFEWYHPYKNIRDIITQYITDKANARVLYPGCGTSKLPEEMYNDGFRNVISIDSTQSCIDEMRARYNDKMPKTFLFLKMDALRMDFGDKIFTHVVDKGLLDAIASGYRSTENIHTYLSEVYRVLQDNGVYFCLSYRDEKDRNRFLERIGWKVHVHRIYRPKYKTELRFIKEEYLSKKVIKEIEQDMEVKLEEKDFTYDDQDNVILKSIMDKEQAQKEQRDHDIKSLKPRQVDNYFIYVCVKGENDRPNQTSDIQLVVEDPDNEYQNSYGEEQDQLEGEEEYGYGQEQNPESVDGSMFDGDDA